PGEAAHEQVRDDDVVVGGLDARERLDGGGARLDEDAVDAGRQGLGQYVQEPPVIVHEEDAGACRGVIVRPCLRHFSPRDVGVQVTVTVTVGARSVHLRPCDQCKRSFPLRFCSGVFGVMLTTTVMRSSISKGFSKKASAPRRAASSRVSWSEK